MIRLCEAARYCGPFIVVLGLAACGGQTDDTPEPATETTTPATPAPTAEDRDDNVERALDLDATLAPFGLDADDKNDRIVLKGTVASAEQRDLAAQVAQQHAAGVTIDNQIRVDANRTSAARPADVDDIEEVVEDALEADTTLRDLDIDVDEEDGKLVLTGKVPSAAHRTTAEEIARRLAGTVTVVNKIQNQ
jgi:osmotically-inducible protein OsmY